MNYRDITDRKQADEEMAVISEIGRVAGSTLDINQVFELVDAEVHKLIPHDRLLVNLKKNDNEFVVAYVSGTDNPRRRTGDLYARQGTASGVVMNARAGILIQPDDAEEIKELYPNLYAAFKTGLRSTISVPLISMSEVIGSMNLRSEKQKAYTEHDLRLAERIGVQIAGAIANAQMFNDLSKTEKSLRESEEKFRVHIENSFDVIFTLNSEGLFVFISPAWERHLGYPVSDAIGKPFVPFLHPDDVAPFVEYLNGILSTGQSETSPAYRAKHANGGWIWMITNGTPYVNRKGEQQFIGVGRNITEQKLEEAEKRSLEERLQRAEKMEALGQLAGGVAHDLNNVLGILSGYSELLRDEIPEDNPARGHVDKILQSTKKGAAIIQDLLTLARRGVTVSNVINLNTVVSDFLETPVFDKFKNDHPHVTFRTEKDDNLLNIKGSPVHLEKALMNLVSNAAEAITETGEVTIRTENRHLDKPIRGYDEVKEGDYTVLVVSDTGMGIPAESIGKIFEPFYTKKKMGKSGTGLGLAIVWGTVKDHNGHIDLQTEEGKGTTFSLYFPVTQENLVLPEAEIPLEQYMGKGETVLVVDDKAEQRDIAARLLTKLGYQVHCVSSGEEAVEHLKTDKADILVLDMIMTPGIDGL
ncbi:MAG: ATP-binding protein, partial [Deltaproteobacteria bacterium]